MPVHLYLTSKQGDLVIGLNWQDGHFTVRLGSNSGRWWCSTGRDGRGNGYVRGKEGLRVLEQHQEKKTRVFSASADEAQETLA